MSEDAENTNDPDQENDPTAPTELDPRQAFAMGAETPPSVPAHWSPPDAEVMDPLFPQYTISELIGRGGMGAVYKGVQESLDRPVAIKVLPPEMAEVDPSFAARFEREAKSMAKLDHPNIVHVYDFGRTEAGHWYIVMEFVDGMDFHQLIRTGTLDPTGALNAVSQICDALEYAHSKGYVHRDIKPANIFINQEGILKVGDFGLAKLIEGENPEDEDRDQPMLTQTGISMGTPDYCAPEQMEGKVVDQRADIYSLGVMFYEMLTRELPRGNFPPPSKKVQIDVRIDDVVLRAMESEPEFRYSSAGEMRTEVDAVRTGAAVAAASGETAVPIDEVRKRKQELTRFQVVRRAIFWGGLAVCLVGLGNLVYEAMRNRNFAKPPTEEKAVETPVEAKPVSKEGVFPLPLPEFPPKRPEGAGRIVFVKLSEDAEPLPEWIRQVEERDLDDVVRVSKWHDPTYVGRHHLVALRSNGGLQPLGNLKDNGDYELHYLNQLSAHFDRGAVQVACSGTFALVLDEHGKIHSFPQDKQLDFDTAATLSFGNSSRAISIDPKGACHFVRNIDEDEEAIIRREVIAHGPFVQVLNSTSAGSRWGLRADGSLRGYSISNNRQITLPPGSAASLSDSRPAVLSAEGKILVRFHDHNWQTVSGLPAVDPKGSRLTGATNRAAILQPDGNVMICGDIVLGGSRMREAEKALSGAHDLKFWGNDYLIAVLPAESVSRSGLWEVDELVADRQQLLEAKNGAKPEPVANEGDPFPLPKPKFPLSAGSEECRLVIIPLAEEQDVSNDQEWLEKVRAKDSTNVARLAPSMFGDRPLSICADGRIELYGSGSGPHSSLLAAAHNQRIVDVASSSNYYFLLTHEGELWEVPKSAAKAPTQWTGKYIAIGTYSNGGMIALRSDGELQVLNRASTESQDKVQAVIDAAPGGFVAISSSPHNNFTALRGDGSTFGYQGFGENVALPTGSVTTLSEISGFGVQSDGRGVLTYGATGNPPIELIDGGICWHRIWLGIHRGNVAALSEDGSVGFWLRNEKCEPFEHALNGVVDLKITEEFVYALLPAETVSRSGYWEVDDLIADRQQLLGEASKPAPETASPFPLPLPEFPPKRADVSCRIIFVRVPGSEDSDLPEWPDEVEHDDDQDIVTMAEVLGDEYLVVIRATGNSKAWGNEWKMARANRYPARDLVKVVQRPYPNPGFYGLTQAGEIRKLSREDEEWQFPMEVRELADLQANAHELTAVRKDGTAVLFGSPSRTKPIHLKNVASCAPNPTSPGFVVLHRDGSVVRYRISEPPEVVVQEEGASQLLNAWVAQGPSGSFIALRNDPGLEELLALHGPEMKEIHFSRKGDWALEKPGANWSFGRLKSGLMNENLSAALQGSVEIQFRGKGSGADLIVALVPAETVSRSGLWEIDDLIADRQQLLEAENGAKPKPVANDDDPFPLRRPSFPLNRPENECRVVVLSLAPGDSNPPGDWVEELKSDDPSDAVEMWPLRGDEYWKGVQILRSDGARDSWGTQSHLKRKPDPRIVSEIGRISLHKTGETHLPGGSYASSDLFVKLSIGPGGTIGVREDGRMVSFEKEDARSEMGDLNRNVVATGWHHSSARFAMLHEDGSVSYSYVLRREPHIALPPGSAIFLDRHAQYALGPSGQLKFLLSGGVIPPTFKGLKTEWKWVSAGISSVDGKKRDSFVGISPNRLVEVWPGLGHDGFRAEPELEKSLLGAIEAYIDGEHIFALLPADTVTRSGYWEVEDLIADRRKLQGEKPDPKAEIQAPKSEDSLFPLPTPEFPPKRPKGDGRIVYIQTQSDAPETPDWWQEIETADVTNVARVAALPEVGIIALQSNGEIKAFGERIDGERRFGASTLRGLETTFSGGAVSIVEFEKDNLRILDEDGLEQVFPNAKDGEWRNLVALSGGAVKLGLHPDGKLSIRSSDARASQEMAIQSLTEGKKFVAIQGSLNAAAVMALQPDGSLLVYFKTGQTYEDVSLPSGSVAALGEKGLYVLSSKGEILVYRQHDWLPVPRLPLFDSQHSRLISGRLSVGEGGAGPVAVVIQENGEIVFCTDVRTGVRNREWEKAFEGALDFEFADGRLFAVLPAGSVPRSGYWEVAELIAAREAMKKEAGN